MNFGIAAMLFGLFAVGIPVIIHLLNRRHYEMVDWGAMQFLKISETTRRKIFIEELLLMLVRMGILAVLVLGLAAPSLTESFLSFWRGWTGNATAGLTTTRSRANYDFVLVLDGSASMSYRPIDGGESLQDLAKKWALELLGDLIPGDRVSLLLAGQQLIELQAEPSRDLDQIRDAIKKLPPPTGGVDWPAAVERAGAILEANKSTEAAIILIGDGQRYGWAHREALEHWTLLSAKLGVKKGAARPPLYYVNVDPDRGANEEPPNWSLGPLEVNRPVVPVGREVRFKGTLELRGQKEEYRPPYRLTLQVDDDKPIDLKPPQQAKLDKGRLRLPFEFKQAFGKRGSHLVHVTLEADPPPEKRPAGYVVRDRVSGDNQRDFAIEVLDSLSVLIVDGDLEANSGKGRSHFLRLALSPKTAGVVSAINSTVISLREFTERKLLGLGGEGNNEAADKTADKPRVLILCDVAELSAEQNEAIDKFLAEGGGVLVTTGERANAEAYNRDLYREGKGWLPTLLQTPTGDESDLNVAPQPGSSDHPALALVLPKPGAARTEADLADARFPRWWQVATPSRQSAARGIASFVKGDKEHLWLIEKPYRAGRVIQSTVPLDASWNTNLTDLQSFVPLAHELVYYLARARSSEFNLAPGQPLRYRMEPGVSTTGFSLQPPFGDKRPLVPAPGDPATTYPAQFSPQPRGMMLLYEKTREPGVYRLSIPEGKTIFYVVQPDDQESNLAPCSAAERERVAALIDVQYGNDAKKMMTMQTSIVRMEIWWWFMIGMILLLCGEVWMTRRMVKNR